LGMYVSQARGLRAFTAPMTSFDERGDGGTDYANDVFKLDGTAKRGSASYACARTGRLFWIEDEKKGVTGFAWRDSKTAKFHNPPTVNGFLCEPERAIVKVEPESDV